MKLASILLCFAVVVMLVRTSTISKVTSPLDCDYLILWDNGNFEITSCTFLPSGNDFVLTILYQSKWQYARADQINYRVFDGEELGYEVIQKLDNNTHDQGEIIEGKYVLKAQLLPIYKGFQVTVQDRYYIVMQIYIDEPLQARPRPTIASTK